MQGRLLPKYQDRYQAHPVGYWQDEFIVAREIGLDCIEFILDYNDAEDNPLIKDGGIDVIKAVIERTGVSVKTICADYFMEAPLHSENIEMANSSQKLMISLLNNTAELGVTDVVIPCVDQSTLADQVAADRFVEKLLPVVVLAEKHGINLSLETDLAPQAFVELLERFNSHRVTVNYDIGNSAALGYNPVEELECYGKRITDIHIKDRVLDGGPVVLGEGDADFPAFFNKLKEFDYQGPFIMQAYRDVEGVDIFKKQLDWVKSYLNE
jgi:sugar phosphate isomerase/epimerase